MIKLKEIRKSKGITQKQIGEYIGVSCDAVSHYETGRRKLNQDQIIKIVKALDVTADYFLGLIDKDNKKVKK